MVAHQSQMRTGTFSFFKTNRLTPFGIYCICAGLFFTVAFAL